MTEGFNLDLWLTDSEQLKIRSENASPAQKLYIDHLTSLVPAEEQLIFGHILPLFDKIRSANRFRRPETALTEQEMDLYESYYNEHPIETLHFLYLTLDFSEHRKVTGPTDRSLRRSEAKFLISEITGIESRLENSINYHLIYLGALKEMYSQATAESARTGNHEAAILAQGIIGLIHERIKHLNEKQRLAGRAPENPSAASARMARNPEIDRWTTKKGTRKN